MWQNILLISANPHDAMVVQESVLNSPDGRFKVDWVTRCSEGLERLSSPGGHEITALVTDLLLPDSAGIETFEKLFRASPDIPILILCGVRDEDAARQAVQRGAQDYLLREHLDGYSLPKALSNMVERTANAEALFIEKERAQVTLNSIGDGVICTDVLGNVTYLNLVAERMTGWSREEASGRPLQEVLRIVDGTSREPALNPMTMAIVQNKTVALTPNCILIRRDGYESAIEDSAAPIHDRKGQVTGAVIVFHDVSVARAMSLRMSYLAQHDFLTGLPNRMLLDDRLTQAIGLGHRHGKSLAVLFVDVDHFKHINDSLGHAIGDRLLQSIARRMVACVRGSDTVSRLGGDEFVILLSEVEHAEDAAVSAEKLLIAVSMPHRIDEHDLHVTVSLGIGVYPGDGTDKETLMNHADIALAHAKNNGRNNFQFFEQHMNVRADERHTLESGLRRALQRGELVLHYQPTVNLETGTLSGVEALIRWQHPERGLLLPAQFLPVAEASGFIVTIGQWVVREACREARARLDEGLAPIAVAINVCALELRTKGFVDGIRAALSEMRLEPPLLQIELTESVLMHDSQSTAEVLRALRAIGIGLTLDDFGTGYASLSYLRRFPIDALKIDPSFVRNITTDLDDASIVSAVVSMGRSLNRRVIAEGVETREQLAVLRAHQCGEGQGYYFSRPMPAAEFAALLGSGMRASSLRKDSSSRHARRT